MDYDDTNRGILFQEQDKKTDKSPDYTGKLNVEGKEYRLAGWKRQSKNGKPFLSLSISEPDAYKQEKSGYDFFKEQAQKIKQPDTVVEVADDEPISLDDIPF